MIDIIIPHFNKNGFRERNLQQIVYYYSTLLPKANIIIIEQVKGISNSVAKELSIEISNVMHKTLIIDDLFNKSKLLNYAISNFSKYENIVMMDNDIILNDCSYNDLICPKDKSILYPFNSIHFMNEFETRKFILNDFIFDINKINQPLALNFYTGGINCFSKHTWYRVGGYDEIIKGWGSEDDAFKYKCTRLINDVTNGNKLAFHLYHTNERTTDWQSNPQYLFNRKISLLINRMNHDDFIEYCSIGGSDIEFINELYLSYNKNNLLEHIVDIPIGDSFISVDISVYNNINVDNSYKVTLSDLLSAILEYDGKDVLVSFINRLQTKIHNINDETNYILNKYLGM